MRSSTSAASGWLRLWQLFKLLSPVVAFVLIVGALHATPALAQFDPLNTEQCDENDPDADTEGCLEQQGSNSTRGDVDNEGTGGDGVAGSNVIGVTGSGNSNITANNQSGFAKAEGGDVENRTDVNLDTGPELTVLGGDTHVTAIATGNALITQQATPTILAELEQLATSSGTSEVSNTAASLNSLTATNTATGSGAVVQAVSPVSQTATGGGATNATANATGVGPVTQTVTQGGAAVDNLVAPVVSTTATNSATFSGSTPVNQTGLASTNPTAVATAAPNNTRGRLFQKGSNSTRGDIDNAGTGGDGVAGSNVIGVALAGGSSTINATNQSDFADGQGGDVDNTSTLTADNGPDLLVDGGDTTVRSIATGLAQITQRAAPTITLDLTQDATATGLSEVSNTATALNDLTATNTVTGTGSVSQTVTPTTGGSPVTPTATGSGGVSPTATGAGGVTPTATGAGPLNATASATGVGPLSQLISQGASTVSNTVSPVVNVTTGNTALVTGTAPVAQTAAAFTDPTAIAEAGPNNTLGTLLHRGSNDLALDIDNAGVGGDGVAGSNVIGVAGAGNSTIRANNQSDFAKGIGGSVENDTDLFGDNGPDLTVIGSDVTVRAIAEGTAIVSQTAAPVVTFDLTQSANSNGLSAGGSSTVTNTATGVNATTGNTATLSGSAPVTQFGLAVTNPTAIAISGPGPGGVSLSSSASGLAGIGQFATPNFGFPIDQSSFAAGSGGPLVSVLTTNGALLFGSSPVAQTAFALSSPLSAATP